jgi:phosphoacetylglucosamine mutase
VPTGVKNAYPVTSQYIIGANDEPNGHGTIQVKWNELNKLLMGQEDDPAAKRLVGLLRMTNLAVGDAICNLLMIESVLRDKDFSISQFHKMYADLPCKTLKVEVKDRTAFKTTWDENELTQPAALQDTINMWMM